MAKAVIMPRQGQSVESCLITEIKKGEGDIVTAGEVLFCCETDKAAFEVEAEFSGTLLKWLAKEGDDVPVLANVCVIGELGEDISAFLSGGENRAKTSEQPEIAEDKGTEKIADPRATGEAGETRKISPRARLLAENRNVDLSKTVPTGPEGRIIERDVALATKQHYVVTAGAKAAYKGGGEGTGIGGAVTTADLNSSIKRASATFDDGKTFTEEKLTNVRKIIAKSMRASLLEAAQLTMTTSFNASALLSFRNRVKESGEAMGLHNITLNDMILYATIKTLKKHSACNANILGDTIRYFNTVNMGVAVDTDRGLLVPTIFGADRYSLNELSAQAKRVVDMAKQGNIPPDLLTGGTFTVTNLGALGVESFTPVINPPQTCILGVCAISEKIRTVNGKITVYPSMGLSLTFDHCALDGAPAARFLKELAETLENFDLLLA